MLDPVQYFPAGQVIQAVELDDPELVLYLPAGQLYLVPPVQYDPGGQLTHLFKPL